MLLVSLDDPVMGKNVCNERAWPITKEKHLHVPKNRKGRNQKSEKSDSKSQTSKISPEKVCRVKKSETSTSKKNDTWIQGFSNEELW